MRRKITAALVATVIGALLASCTEQIVVGPQSTTLSSLTVTEAEDTYLSDDLPEFDFKGYEFHVLTGKHSTYPVSTFSVEGETGESLNDALYRRNRKIEERFNIKFKETVLNDIYDVNKEIKKTVQAGDDTYDMAMMIDRYARAAAMDGLLYSYYQLPYINLDKDYWSQKISQDFSIGGKLYFTAGDDNLVYFGSVTNLVFNKNMISDYGLESPYDLIRSGKWTMGKYYEMARSVVKDLDGDGKYTDTDQYGAICCSNMYFPNFWLCSGEKLIEKDSNDLPYFNIPDNDRLFAIFQSLYDLSFSDNVLFNVSTNTVKNYKTTGNEYNLVMEMFKSGRSLFASSSIITIMDTREMEDDFGIIPYPVYEEVPAGTPYGCRTFGGFPYVVPSSASNPERISVIMEALACESHNSIIPVLYDIVLKTKISRDADSEEMLDMMRDNRYTDLGESYWQEEIEYKYEMAYNKSENKMASLTESLVPKVEELLSEAIESFEKLQ